MPIVITLQDGSYAMPHSDLVIDVVERTSPIAIVTTSSEDKVASEISYRTAVHETELSKICNSGLYNLVFVLRHSS